MRVVDALSISVEIFFDTFLDSSASQIDFNSGYFSRAKNSPPCRAAQTLSAAEISWLVSDRSSLTMKCQIKSTSLFVFGESS